MKWISNILSLALILLLCSADGCNDGTTMAEARAEKQISATKDSIRQVFEVAFPGDQLLRAYEETAKQKLIDFADYLKIATDSSLDIAFRQQATEMAGKLFISGNTDITSWTRAYPEPGIKTVDYLLEKSLTSGINFWTQPVQVNIRKSLRMKNDTIYEGNLSFYQRSISFEKQNFQENISELLVIDIYTIRKVKPFGKETLSVWEVCLGDVRTAVRQ